MAEYRDYGPGWSGAGRAQSNVTKVLDRVLFGPYSTVEQVFQFAFSGELGNVAWIDRSPES